MSSFFGIRASNNSRGAGNGGSYGGGNGNSAKIEKLFQEYSSSSGEIDPEGTQKFCEDLGFDVMDPVALVLCYHFDCKKMGFFSHEEFVKGMNTFGVSSIEELRQKVPEMRVMLRDPNNRYCKGIYQNSFVLSLEEGQKQLLSETAIDMWKLILENVSGYGNPQLAQKWVDYVENHAKKKSISKDVWNMTYDLLITSDKNDMTLTWFDEDGAWPVLIDEFVEHVKKEG